MAWCAGRSGVDRQGLSRGSVGCASAPVPRKVKTIAHASRIVVEVESWTFRLKCNGEPWLEGCDAQPAVEP